MISKNKKYIKVYAIFWTDFRFLEEIIVSTLKFTSGPVELKKITKFYQKITKRLQKSLNLVKSLNLDK